MKFNFMMGLVLCAGCSGAGDEAANPTRQGWLPALLDNPVAWLLLAATAVGVIVFAERTMHYHTVQINTTEFIGGLRNVLRRDNVVEAISICEATPSPAARLVKAAILNRERSRVDIRDALEQAGTMEVAALEARLPVLATLGQVAPLLGLLGTVVGFMDTTVVTNLHAHFAHALAPTALGLAVGVPAYVGYNYLVATMNSIMLEMERTSLEAMNLVTEAELVAGRETPVKKRKS